MTAKRNVGAYDHHRGKAPLLRQTNPWRTGVFLAVNLAGFAVVNAFRQYLSTGKWVDFTISTYLHDLTTPLGKELFSHPLDIFTHPWMILVVAGLLGLVVFVPIIVAVLYRLVFAAMFVIVVALVGHAPGLALVLAVGCVLAARTPLRSDMPFLAALLGMILVGGYLVLSGLVWGQATAVPPLQRWVMHSPFLLAMVLAVLAAAAVLASARLTGFRPGVVWPVLAVLLVGPLAVFYTQVGQGELDYVLIVKGLKQPTGDAVFKAVTLEDWTEKHRTDSPNRRMLAIHIREDLELRRQGLISQCEAFLAKYPRSKRAAAVLWLKAQCMSLRLDTSALQMGLDERPGVGQVRCSASFPLPASAGVWRRLSDNYGGTPQAALGRWRLGELALRRLDMPQAGRQLHAAAEGLRRHLRAIADRRELGKAASVFSPSVGVPAHQYYTEALFAVERLIWLIDRNDAPNDEASAEALAAYLKENPHEPNYYERLGKLVGKYEKTKMGDNLKLAFALATESLYERANMLILLAEDERQDAAIEANYELGRLAMRTAEAPPIRLIEKLKTPQEYFRKVTQAPPNPWGRLAEERLTWLAARPKETP